KYYMCSVGEVYKAALPSGLKLESETQIIYNPEANIENSYTSHETLILDFLEKRTISSIQELSNFLKRKDILPLIKTLLEKKAIFLEEKLRENYKPKTELYISLHESIQTEERLNEIFGKLKKATKQEVVLTNYINLSGAFLESNISEVSKQTLIKSSGATSTTIKTLIEKNIFIEYEKLVSRLNETEINGNSVKKLSEPQQEAYELIQQGFAETDVVLLHGVTSSGKTEIYIQLIKEQIEKGKQVLYLLPEIALTAQIINRLTAVFGRKVGIYHSKFSDSERVEVYQNVLNENKTESAYQVILGVRSSLFLPFSKLGLIIIDEEHENTYKQYDPAPRYNARDSAIVLAQIHNAKVLLGSATPSVDSYYNAKTEKYKLVELNSRFKDIMMPDIQIVDVIRARKKKEMKSHFTPELVNQIENALNNKKQVILFQNRRGFSPYLECEKCGWIPNCPNCDVSLTYHQFKNELVCHYCGFSVRTFKACTKCSVEELSTRGFGTEKIEDDIKILFPQAKVIRMDLDSTRSKHAYEKIISSFESGEVDILIGTQMVSKGLDFDNVSLVGIMNADSMLNYPDFRSFERSFQLMAQVSGRAGRKNKQGKVILQTNNPQHPILLNVIENDFIGMYKSQLLERKNFNYPPYVRLINLSIKHRKSEITDQASSMLSENLRKIFGKRVLGPEAPIIGRIQNLYIKNILLKIERQASFQKAKTLLNIEIENLLSQENFKTVQITIDVDPV
ncbi:MAG: primosomal protein N', partial [Bacteroidetes bacterium GWA2_31_9b]